VTSSLTPGFDPAYTERCFEENLRFLAEEYFRARLIGEQHLPLDQIGKRAIIVVANHSGMGLSWDNIILDFLLYDLLKRHHGGDGARAVRAKVVRIVDPLLVSHTMVRPFGIADWWTRIRALPATFANFERAVQDKQMILVSPEGVAGIAKGYHRRYRLQRYSSGFLALAHKYGATVVPTSVVNAEYLRPYNYSFEPTNRWARKIGMPFLPLGLGLPQLLFPATYLTAWPAKLTYVLHEPIEYLADEVARSRDALAAETRSFAERHQALLLRAVAAHHAPFDLTSLWRSFRASRRKRMYLPFFWHEMFLRTAGVPKAWAPLFKVPAGYPLIWAARRLGGRGASERGAGGVLDREREREETHDVAA